MVLKHYLYKFSDSLVLNYKGNKNMKKLLVILSIFISTNAYAYLSPGKYSISVTRVDNDLYKTMFGTYIKTRYCYEYVYYDDAILIWNGKYSWNNKIIFNDGEVCDVEDVF